MVRLRASKEGIKKVRNALNLKGWTHEHLAGRVECSRTTIHNLLSYQKIEFHIFEEVCNRLGFELQDIATPEPEDQAQNNSVDIDALVQEVREKVKFSIQERCATMRVLDMSQPIGLNDIYTNVNILEKITGRRRKEVAELLQEFKLEDFERFGLDRISEERVPGLKAVEKYNKLLILGKPGAGKTTFLRYLAIQCNSGEFQADFVPIFVTLKDFTEATKQPNLLEYIGQQFSACGVIATQVADLFNQSRALVLLDGLDEVREEDNSRALKEIRDFSKQFYGNYFVITCRIAARDYTFEKFTEVEVADFDDEQIATFATNWFKNKAVKSEIFIKRLKENNRIKELATNPLLLTLLCLVFEGSLDFPANRSELYEEGLEALLKKWDAGRGIERNQVYKKLSLKRKKELLSKIALTTFEGADYFFKQRIAEQYITDYIRNLPDANNDPETLQLDSEVVLRSIEAQHGVLVERAKGIYSFSHLTFHEYFTAREVVFGTQPLEEALQNLVSHITEKRWREVFLLTVGMLSSADYLLLLMKQQIDALVAADEKLQRFLKWIKQKSFSSEIPCKSAARAYYLIIELNIAHVLGDLLVMDIVPEFVLGLGIEPERDFNDMLLCENSLACMLDLGSSFVSEKSDSGFCSMPISNKPPLSEAEENEIIAEFCYVFVGNLHNAIDMAFNQELHQSLQKLKEQIPKLLPKQSTGDWEDIIRFLNWMKINGETWLEKLKTLMIIHCNIGQDWQFTNKQKQLLKQYYDTNQLLVECLKNDCYVSREVRQEIEDTLLLPIAEIEQRKGRLV